MPDMMAVWGDAVGMSQYCEQPVAACGPFADGQYCADAQGCPAIMCCGTRASLLYPTAWVRHYWNQAVAVLVSPPDLKDGLQVAPH